MLKTLKKQIIVATVLAGCAMSNASAFSIDIWSDSFDPTDFKLNAPDSYLVTHDITDGPDGFRPGIDSIYLASLSIWLYDDGNDRWFEDEEVKFNYDGTGWSWSHEVDNGGWFTDEDLFLSWPTDLLLDGLLNINVKASEGDFWFSRSELHVAGKRGTQVPEPATLALFGVGLLGLGLTRRRKSRG